MKSKICWIIFVSILAVTNIPKAFCIHSKSFADQLLVEGRYLDAAVEFQRQIYFEKGDNSETMLKIANCYVALNKPDNAKYFFNLCYTNAISDSVKAEAIIGTTILNLLSDNSISALGEQFSMPQGATPAQLRFGAMLEAFCYVQANNFADAETALYRSRNQTATDSLAVKQTIKYLKRLQKKYSPTRGYYLSLWLPGSGQLQARKPKAALNSVALVGTLFYLTTKIAIQYSFIDAMATMYPWLYRYYLGGANKAELLNTQKIEDEKKQFFLNQLSSYVN